MSDATYETFFIIESVMTIVLYVLGSLALSLWILIKKRRDV